LRALKMMHCIACDIYVGGDFVDSVFDILYVQLEIFALYFAEGEDIGGRDDGGTNERIIEGVLRDECCGLFRLPFFGLPVLQNCGI
jgi:hypothetical protein